MNCEYSEHPLRRQGLSDMGGAQSSRRCQLTQPIRDAGGTVRFRENAEILHEVDNLGRRMILVRFDDGATTFLFPHEVKVLE
jgi:hypothetical protein